MTNDSLPPTTQAKHVWTEPQKAWLEALSSGKFQQTKGSLKHHNTNSFCCLGVACEISNMGVFHASGYYYLIGSDGIHGRSLLPEKIEKRLGLLNYKYLAGLNDTQGKTFDEIADYIESNPSEFFVS
jgi:hypothetical protein